MSGPYATSVQQYRDLGWQGALPVGLVVNNGSSEWHAKRKRTVPKGYTGYDGRWPDHHAVARWVKLAGHCNIGLRVPDGLLGIDVDQYGNKRGLDNLAEHQRLKKLSNLGPLLVTTIRSSSRRLPSGIFWFRVPNERRWQGAPVPGVELIQRGHRYAIVWPSVHPSGATYGWTVSGDAIDPPSIDDARFLWLPDAWAEELTAPDEVPADHPPSNEHREADWSDQVTAVYDDAVAALHDKETSDHEATRGKVMRLLRLEQTDHAGATAALDTLERQFVAAVTNPARSGDTRSADEAQKEWERLLDGGRKKVRTTQDPRDDPSWIDAQANGDSDQHNDNQPAPSNGGRYFSKKIGLHVATLADDIVAMGPLAEGSDDIVWSYHAGVWNPARYLVRERAAQLLGQRYRRSHGGNAEDVVRQRSTKITCDPVSEVVNFRNGLYLWQADQLRDHDPAVLSTVQLTVDWHPDAQCPTFDRFLGQVVPEDMVPVVWEAIGYLLYSGNPLHKAYMLIGAGRNGKGTLLRVVVTLLGARNVTAVSLHDLVGTRFSTASLFGKIANIAGDIDATYLESTATFKAITGQDQISAEHKGRDRFDFTPWAVPVFSANKVPPSADVTTGYLSRWLVIPFPNDFTGREDRRLDAKLQTKDELQGIAAKAMPALRRLMDRGEFDLPESGLAARDEFTRRVDQVRTWVDECCAINSDDRFIARTELYQAYKAWAQRDGYKPVRAGEFYERLSSVPGCTAHRIPEVGTRGFLGIRVTDKAAGQWP